MREEIEGLGEDPAKKIFEKKVKPFIKKPTSTRTAAKEPITDWETISKAVTDKDKAMIKRIGASFGRPRLIQEGVAASEVEKQIMSLAPGHVLVGPLLLDLHAKL